MTSCLQPRILSHIRCVAWFAMVLAATPLLAASGDEHWDGQFGWPGTTNSVRALAVNGNQVYAGGSFFGTAALATNNFIEVWDGARWSYLPGLEDATAGLLLFDFAFLAGELYVAGKFTRAGTNRAVGLARWNGTRWSDVGGFEGTVRATVSDGSKIYVGGAFTNAGGVHVTNVACWNGSQWFAVGGGLGLFDQFQQFAVEVLHLHQGDLYAGGVFTNSGSARVRNVARWNGSTWVEFGGGANAPVRALASEGSSLYAGGDFNVIGSTAANRIARSDGTNWFPLGSGADGQVSAIGVLDGRVHIGGTFSRVGGVSAMRFAVWNGTSWAATGSGLNGGVNRMKVAGTNLYVGGDFTQADDILVNHVGVWNGTNWSGLSQVGRANGLGDVTASVRAIASAGNDIYAGGTFTRAGKIRANRIARFDGSTWHPLGLGVVGTNLFGGGTAINALAINGNDVYAGGVFTNIGGVRASNIARWDGNAWSALSNGIPGPVTAIAVRGNDVFVGGDFFMFTPGGGAAFSIARWNGSTWSALPGSIGGVAIRVNAIAVQGNNVILGGAFATGISGGPSTNVTIHNGNDWLPMGGGVNGEVRSIAVLGTNVFVAGDFTRAGGVDATRIARWNGSSWSSLGTGLRGSGQIFVPGLATIGTNLYAGGNFTNADGVSVNGVARWDGNAWSALGSGLTRGVGSATVNVLRGRENDLLVGGTFEYAGGKPSSLLARWNDQIDFNAAPTIQLGKLLGSSTGPFQMTVTASGMPSYVIEATTDFASWTALMTNTASPFEFSDFTAPSRPHRFYRARQGP